MKTQPPSCGGSTCAAGGDAAGAEVVVVVVEGVVDEGLLVDGRDVGKLGSVGSLEAVTGVPLVSDWQPAATAHAASAQARSSRPSIPANATAAAPKPTCGWRLVRRTAPVRYVERSSGNKPWTGVVDHLE